LLVDERHQADLPVGFGEDQQPVDQGRVDNQPARVREDFDLETVCPPSTWARVAAPAAAVAGVAE
jgi:hypothetical protein